MGERPDRGRGHCVCGLFCCCAYRMAERGKKWRYSALYEGFGGLYEGGLEGRLECVRKTLERRRKEG